MGADELDDLYFVPGALLPVLPDMDPQFTTHGDYLFAKFPAYEWLKEILLEMLSTPAGAEGSFLCILSTYVTT